VSTTPTLPSTEEIPFMPLRVARKVVVARDITYFELRDPSGAALPPYTPGAHLTVELPGGARRNYSLCGDCADQSVYPIAVKRDAAGRGGSMTMTDQVEEGDLLQVSAPRNNFELHPRASSFLFIAGGIGITPILSMMRYLRRMGSKPFRLIYITRDAEGSAFLEALQGEFAEHVQVHHTREGTPQPLDLWPVFENPTAEHVYCCGPRPLMDAVADMSGHWPTGNIHFESFGVDAAVNATNTAFDVRLARSGAKVHVEAEESLLDALRRCGVRVASSCESGTCGTCRTGLLEGEAEHRDMVLLEEERPHQIMVCVSRAVSAELVLDL
jgi:phthalate 4,5-dioxygenase reductase subunit